MAERVLRVAVVADNEQLVRTFAKSSSATAAFGRNVSHADRELSRASRGALAGTGVFRGLGRSIAFASGGFLAFASAGQFLRSSVDAARDAAVTQRQLAQQLRVSGQAWATYRSEIEDSTDKLSRLSGFNVDDLEKSLTTIDRGTGDVTKALRLNALAADIARGRNVSLATASIAVGKAAAGSTTSLRRLGIQLPAGATGAEALALATEKFAGQARAGATESDRFAATLHNTEVIVGQALLPVLNRYLGELGDWLEKMDRSGRLQKDANTALHRGEEAFTVIGRAISGVDRVTGSFGNTLKVLLALKLASIIRASWIPALEQLAAKWGLVQGAAVAAEGATAAAAGTSAGAAGTATSNGRIPQFPLIVPSLTGPANSIPTKPSLPGGIRGLPLAFFGSIGDQVQITYERVVKGGNVYVQAMNKKAVLGSTFIGIEPGTFLAQARVPGFLQFPGFPSRTLKPQPTRPFGGIQPQRMFTQHIDLTPLEQLAQAEAALTKTTRDDVAAARQVVARIKRLIDQGRLKGAALVQALGLEASALSTIWAAEDAAAQARAQKAQAAKARIIKQIQNAIDPLELEVALSRAQAFGQPIVPRLRALLRAAYKGLQKAIAANNLELEKQALDQIASLKQQIKDALTQPTVTFQLSPKLQLALARDEALGLDPTKDLLKARKAILHFIATHRKNIQALTDAYNQLAAINQQLGQSANAYGDYKKASLKALTAGLGLSADARRRLEASLSRLGPGGTTPMSGTGAAGFIIDPDTGRPIHRGTRRPRYGGSSSDRPVFNTDVDVKVYIDGAQVEAKVTQRQQRRRRHNPTQRRGPNAATATA